MLWDTNWWGKEGYFFNLVGNDTRCFDQTWKYKHKSLADIVMRTRLSRLARIYNNTQYLIQITTVLLEITFLFLKDSSEV
jgi:hypothetical protein